MITWSDIDDAISEVLLDTNYSLYPLADRIAASNWALSVIAWYKPVQESITITSGEREIAYPSDLIEVVAVWDGSAWCAPVNFGTDTVGSLVQPGADSTDYERSFWLFGNKVNFTKALTSDGILFYHARYPEITQVTDTIDIANHVFQPLLYLSLAFCLHKNIAQQGVLSVWQEDIETGLSTERLSNTYSFYLKSAIDMLKNMPMKHEELSLLAIRRREYVEK